MVPLQQSGAASTVQKGLSDLSRNLAFPSSAEPGQRSVAVRPITPALWTGDGQRLAVREPGAGPTIAREWLALAGLLGGGLVISLGLRAQWMLNQRRLRLGQIRLERLSNQRIRRTERELNALLDQVQVGGEGNEDQAFARLLKRQVSGDDTGAAEPRSERLALVTNHVGEFERAPGLLIENWFAGLA